MKHKVAILGYGTIGKGVFKILMSKDDFEVAYIFDKKDRFDPNHINLFTDNLEDILNDPTVDSVVEVLGGLDFAYSCDKKCLEHGKNLITANKEVVAAKIDELTMLARENNVLFMFEASVGGGIPIIKTLCEVSRTSTISGIYGILNGTTNYILTKMFEGKGFDEALKDAQDLGFAEKNPAADLEGLDMVRKIAILSDLAWNTYVPCENVGVHTIYTIKEENIKYAKENNLRIKFICSAEKKDDSIVLGVAPYYLDKNHPFYNVNNEVNAILLKTYPNDDLAFIGKGAGSLPTASAIVGDLYSILKEYKFDTYKNINKFELVPLKIGNEITLLEDE